MKQALFNALNRDYQRLRAYCAEVEKRHDAWQARALAAEARLRQIGLRATDLARASCRLQVATDATEAVADKWDGAERRTP
jgi:hypothetical protein